MPAPTPETDCTRTDWPLLIALLALAFIVGAMFGLSFSACMVTL